MLIRSSFAIYDFFYITVSLVQKMNKWKKGRISTSYRDKSEQKKSLDFCIHAKYI